jgi:adenylate kinase family enzyme
MFSGRQYATALLSIYTQFNTFGYDWYDTCMKRVVIIGCPGAGKSTFSRVLAQATNLPLVHLDYYYHDSRFDYENDKEAWRRLVKSLVDQNEWIIEGNYKSTFELRLSRADTIIYFDYPRRISVWRTLKRRVRYHKKLRPEMPSDWKEKISPEFMKFVWSFNKTERPMIYDLLKRQKGKDIVILRSPRQTRQYLDRPGQENSQKNK